MKSIIDGKRYDTDTAEHLHSWHNGYANDFRERSKVLYKTKKGKFFIHHEGGPMTDMATHHGSMVGHGSKIEPVSDEDAFRFLCSHDGNKIAEAQFPDKIQDA